jgi:hypothetical protein
MRETLRLTEDRARASEAAAMSAATSHKGGGGGGGNEGSGGGGAVCKSNSVGDAQLASDWFPNPYHPCISTLVSKRAFQNSSLRHHTEAAVLTSILSTTSSSSASRTASARRSTASSAWTRWGSARWNQVDP